MARGPEINIWPKDLRNQDVLVPPVILQLLDMLLHQRLHQTSFTLDSGWTHTEPAL